MNIKGENMPERQGPEQVSEGGVFGELEVLKGVVRNRFASETMAQQLEHEAAQIRDQAEEDHKGKWSEAKAAIQTAADSNELTDRELLEAIIDFRAITPELKPLRQPRQLVTRKPSGREKPSKLVRDAFDKEFTLAQFDSIQPGQPLLVDDMVGIVSSVAKTKISDQHSALGANLHIDVEFKPDNITEITKSIERDLDMLFVGEDSIQEFINTLKYTSNNRGHSKQNNLDSLMKIKSQLVLLEGFSFNLDHLNGQIAAGERNQEFKRQQRAQRTRFERMVNPR